MTIICAWRGVDGETWMGSDTVVFAGKRRQRFGPKWRQVGPYWIGVAGYLRTLNLVEAGAAGFAAAPSYMALIEQLRAALRDDGFGPAGEDGGPATFDVSLLVVAPDGLYDVGSDFGVRSVPHGELAAAGDGEDFAIGAAFGIAAYPPRIEQGSKLRYGETLVRTAVQAAIEHAESCGGTPWVQRYEPHA